MTLCKQTAHAVSVDFVSHLALESYYSNTLTPSQSSGGTNNLVAVVTDNLPSL